MCYKGNILLCIPVQTACLVLAIINTIINGLVVLYGIVFWGLFFTFVSAGTSFGKIGGVRFKRDVSDHDMTMEGVTCLIIFIIIPLIGLLNTVFSSLLCHGICERRPKLVKVYFWYGLVITVPVIIASVVMLCYDHKSYDPQIKFEAYLESSHMATGGLLLLLEYVPHSLFLVLVHFTHKKLLQNSMFTDHVRLVESRDHVDIRLNIDQDR